MGLTLRTLTVHFSLDPSIQFSVDVLIDLFRNKTSKVELSVELVHGFQPLTIFAKSSILGFCQAPEYASASEGLGVLFCRVTA